MGRYAPIQRFARPEAVHGCLGSLFCALLLASAVLGQEPGQTPRPKDVEPPKEVPEEELVKLDKKFEHFKFIEDDAPFINRGSKIGDVRRMQAAEHEQKAYDYVLHFARRQPDERLQKFSIKNVPVENLFRPIRQDYLRELIHVEGKLALVTAMKPTDDLKDLSEIEQLYEVWVWVNAKGTSKLACVVVSELPDGVKVGEEFDVEVSFDAYFFKLWHYESRQQKEGSKDTDKKQWQRAPLFLGKSFQVTAPIVVQPTYSPVMLMSVIGGLSALGLSAFLISLWFRKGDQHVRASASRKMADQANFENVPEGTPPVNRYPDFS